METVTNRERRFEGVWTGFTRSEDEEEEEEEAEELEEEEESR